MSLRTPGVPVWVTVLAVLLGLFATLFGVLAMLDPHIALGWVSGADALGVRWGGRNTGLGVVLLVAVLLRSPAGYVVAFSGQLLREFGDVVAAGPTLGSFVGTLPFIAVDVLGLVFAVRALGVLRRQARPEPVTGPA